MSVEPSKPSKNEAGKPQRRRNPRKHPKIPKNLPKPIKTHNLELNLDSDSEIEDPDLTCLICDAPLKYSYLWPCGHHTCHTCGLRQRILYDKSSCLVCRSESAAHSVVTSSSNVARDFGSFNSSNTETSPFFAKKSVIFDSRKLLEKCEALIANTCPVKDCHHLTFPTFLQLSGHVRSAHLHRYCALCAKSGKKFPKELPIYTPVALRRHEASGDPAHGFLGHPRCVFCDERFYSEDELNVHLRDKHERCHVCDRLPNTEPRYFQDYAALARHFSKDHYVCPVGTCLEKKFVAFEDEFALRAHMAREHPETGRIVFGTGVRQRGGAARTEAFQTALLGVTRNDRSDLATKKQRLLLRATLYLEHDDAKIREFNRICDEYIKENDITPRELLFDLKQLFVKQKQEELAILVNELCETVPTNSAKRAALQSTAEVEFRAVSEEELFPALSTGHVPDAAVWAGNPRASHRSTTRGRNAFPSLSEAHAVSSQFSRLLVNGSTWGSSSNGNSSSSSLNSAKSAKSEEEDFPALPTPAAAPKVSRQVRYVTGRMRGGGAANASAGARKGVNSGVKIKIVKRRPNEALRVTDERGVQTEEKEAEAEERIGKNQNDQESKKQSKNEAEKKGKKRKEKQVLFHVGI